MEDELPKRLRRNRAEWDVMAESFAKWVTRWPCEEAWKACKR
jgi:hypothetical protein